MDEDIRERVLLNDQLQAIGVRAQVVNQAFKEHLRRLVPKSPDPDYTNDANEGTKLAMRYTRYEEHSK